MSTSTIPRHQATLRKRADSKVADGLAKVPLGVEQRVDLGYRNQRDALLCKKK